MATTADVQAAVDDLRDIWGQPVLIEDARHFPVWWSAQGAVDGTRMRSIMDHECGPVALGRVRALGLAKSTGPVRVEAIPEADMFARWCVPIRSAGELTGYLWVIDGEYQLTETDIAKATACVELAAGLLVDMQTDPDERFRRRTALLGRLVNGPDENAARQLISLEHLAPEVTVGVRSPGLSWGWALPRGMSAHLDPTSVDQVTSGAPVPLIDLSVAVARAAAVRRVLAAGGELKQPTWGALGAWRLIVAAAHTVTPTDVHPGVQAILELDRQEMLITARTVLDLGGDVGRAAELLHVHRTTLYYRLDRIESLVGVNLRTGHDREDLHLALRLAAYHQAAADTTVD